MNLTKKIKALVEWGYAIKSLSENDDHNIFKETEVRNPWFIRQFTKVALNGITEFLDQDVLEKWVKQYHFRTEEKKIGLILAGNVPTVGFHDLLCVLISGHKAVIKLSHQDDILIPFLVNELMRINNKFKQNIQFVENLTSIDAVIATGSDNSARYFKYSYGHRPHIIRNNRTSIAVISGNETGYELEKLADDIFLYFGLGCRNVSKLYLPHNYDLNTFTESFSKYSWLNNHQKYYNNYQYQKTIREINGEKSIDGSFFIMNETNHLVSPIAVIFIEFYNDIREVNEKISNDRNKIQCIVSGLSDFPGDTDFGGAQFPEVNDYSDKIDTMKFLEKLSR